MALCALGGIEHRPLLDGAAAGREPITIRRHVDIPQANVVGTGRPSKRGDINLRNGRLPLNEAARETHHHEAGECWATARYFARARPARFSSFESHYSDSSSACL